MSNAGQSIGPGSKKTITKTNKDDDAFLDDLLGDLDQPAAGPAAEGDALASKLAANLKKRKKQQARKLADEAKNFLVMLGKVTVPPEKANGSPGHLIS